MQRCDTSPFYVRLSKTRVFLAVPFYLLTALFFILPAAFIMWVAWENVANNEPFATLLIVGLIFFGVGAACIAFLVFLLTTLRDERPIAAITKDGFAGQWLFRWREYPWTMQTKIKGQSRGVIILRNYPDNPTFKDKLRDAWWARDAIAVSNVFTGADRVEIKKAIERLNPYA